MRILLSFFLASITTIAIAEPKQLVCVDSAEDEQKRLREVARKYRDPSYVAYSLENAEKFDGYADYCSSAAFGSQMSIVFDTKGLNNPTFAPVEVAHTYLCGLESNDVVKGTVEATPSVISFKYETEWGTNSFNVDRKTLKAGSGTERDSTCVLQDIDTSENLL